MFTRKAIGYFSLASALLMLALVLEDWQLAVLVLPLASMFFLTNSFGFPEKIEVGMEHKVIPEETFGDEDIQITGRIKNDGTSPLENVEIDENLPSEIVPTKGANHFYASLPRGEAVDLSIEFKDPGRGHYPIGPLTIRVRDAFGLYLFERRAGTETLAVMPRPEKIHGSDLRPRHVGPWAGTIPSRNAGVGTEFFNLREYVSGDDVKRINWKATAHSNRLILNEMEAERVTDVMVVLETDVSFYEQSGRELFEQSVKAAASMASLLIRQGNRVGLLLQGQVRGIVSPGFGKRQERKILYLLAGAKPGSAMLPTSYVVNVLARMMLPSHAQLVIISPLLDRSITEGLRELVTAGYSLIVLAPSTTEPDIYSSEEEKMAYRIVQLERSNVLLAVEKICTLVQWPAGVPLSRRLRKVRRIRPPRLA